MRPAHCAASLADNDTARRSHGRSPHKKRHLSGITMTSALWISNRTSVVIALADNRKPREENGVLVDDQMLSTRNGIFELFALNDRTGLNLGLNDTVGRCFHGFDVQAAFAVEIEGDFDRGIFR